MSHIIKRQFFPSLLELDEHAALAHALAVDDPELVEASVRRMREIVTPRRKRNLDTPGRTPFGTEASDTPAYFAETPDRETPRTRQRRNEPGLRYDPTLSLDNFQSRFTSEDNSSFADLLEKNNQERRVKHAWAWEAEQKANVKAIRGREARERLVDMTRTMVERDPNGTVRMISGGAGRPGERMLVVEGVKFDGEGERLMVKGSAETGRLMITSEESASGIIDRKGKGKAVAYIDYDKEDDDAYPIGDPTLDEQDVSVDTWGFTVGHLLPPRFVLTVSRIATRSCSLQTPTSPPIARMSQIWSARARREIPSLSATTRPAWRSPLKSILTSPVRAAAALTLPSPARHVSVHYADDLC